MNRKAIRAMSAKKLGLKTAAYRYAKSVEGLKKLFQKLECLPVEKDKAPLKMMKILKARQYSQDGSCGDVTEVIVESFIDFNFEIILLTVTQRNGETLFCPPIGHRQERSDYLESWQPATIKVDFVKKRKKWPKR